MPRPLEQIGTVETTGRGADKAPRGGRRPWRVAVWAAFAAVASMGVGCAADNSALTTKIAALENDNQALRQQITSLESTIQTHKDRQEQARREGLPTCMRILFELPPQWKQRLRLDLLDFGAGADLNASVMAEADVVGKNINILTGGVTNIWGKRSDVLREKYNIWVMHMAGEDDGAAVFRLINGYNTVSKAAIKAKYGQKFLDNIFQPSGTTVDPGEGLALPKASE